LHQGTHLIPVDFIVGLQPSLGSQGPVPSVRLLEHHRLLLANCIAQGEALLTGGTMGDDACNEHRKFPGNRPSTTIVYKRLEPRVLGALVALYEHKVFVQGLMWGINSYDQWGVELGKKLAASIDAELLATETDSGQLKSATPRDPSTAALISRFRSAAL